MELLPLVQQNFSKDQKRNFFNRKHYDIALNNQTFLLPDIINIIIQYIPNNSLIIIGGQQIQTTIIDSSILYDALNEDWVDLPPLPSNLSLFTSIVYDNKLYIMGGYNPIAYFITPYPVYMFDFSVFKWFTLAHLNKSRYYCTSCVYHDIIYVIGGYFNSESLYSIEVYDPKQPLLGWNVLPSQLNNPRAACVSVVFNNTIYVMGGWDGTNYLDSIEMYDSNNDFLLVAQNLSFKRSFFSAVATKNYIYVMGGYDGYNNLNIVERSDMKSPWVSLPSLPEDKSKPCSVLINNTIYTMGGRNNFIYDMDLSDQNSTWSTFNIPPNLSYMSFVSAPFFL